MDSQSGEAKTREISHRLDFLNDNTCSFQTMQNRPHQLKLRTLLSKSEKKILPMLKKTGSEIIFQDLGCWWVWLVVGGVP